MKKKMKLFKGEENSTVKLSSSSTGQCHEWNKLEGPPKQCQPGENRNL